MEMPAEYLGREQSWLKHCVLREYLVQWAHKLGSLAINKLWFIDCFAGPWKSADQELRDTSIHIGLEALADAQKTWRDKGHSFDVGAVFVEKDPGAFDDLQDYVTRSRAAETVDIRALHGEFGARVPDIRALVGQDPAFIFVDPTGFKGAAMRHIEALTKPRFRDVMVNVMYDHLNRFVDELREHLHEFFGEQVAAGLSERDLLRRYRDCLKRSCGLRYAADLQIPHPTKHRTHFRLVVGGKDKAVLDVFRNVEKRVMGDQAGRVRDRARRRAVAMRTGVDQGNLFDSVPDLSVVDARYAAEHDADLARVAAAFIDLLPNAGSVVFETLWPQLLEEHHVTVKELGRELGRLAHSGDVEVVGWAPRRELVKEKDSISRPRRPLDDDDPT